MHFDKKDTMEIYLYAPFWFVNKTELTLHYRVSANYYTYSHVQYIMYKSVLIGVIR